MTVAGDMIREGGRGGGGGRRGDGGPFETLARGDCHESFTRVAGVITRLARGVESLWALRGDTKCVPLEGHGRCDDGEKPDEFRAG